jgi:hypothetical protein
MDPLLFEMPLETSIEICMASDIGLALANAVIHTEIWGETFHLAGGAQCRTTFREYLDRMMELFGLGAGALPDEAFSRHGFHCGFMDTTKSQRLFQYQQHTLEEYYALVKRKTRFQRPFIRMTKRLAKWYLLKKSPYYKQMTQL